MSVFTGFTSFALDGGFFLGFTCISSTKFHIARFAKLIYTLWISSCIATARERIPGNIDNYVTGVSECSQQRGSLKDDGYR
ncbi:hypothetical protein [Photorhabdus kayaii]|uniref:hypothetical protein n=1 Tax=Photorhabdus kayaii TaxID=230088 RepID=UPI0021D4A2C1|nr:hypothetical protein [Photorhabdus kayaii]MCT8354549.1 hypothetical protein [Photorhabdus kayaii]